MMTFRTVTIIALIYMAASVFAEPVILTGKDLSAFAGKPVADLRVVGLGGEAIPFQADEVTAFGDYVLPMGEQGNGGSGDGVFGDRDELVFLWDDADALPDGDLPNANDGALVVLTRGDEKRAVIVRADPSIPLSGKSYIEYDPVSNRVTTPYYYAVFAKDRFHFTRAGVRDQRSGGFVDLTNELRVAIDLRTLFGLVPIRYTEDNLVCFARRYKAGPVRLLRRGDFHLNLGLGVKGSRAAVNQICYPQIVKVPVRVSVPVRFRTLFSHAHIEMTPVIRPEGKLYRFTVSGGALSLPVDGGKLDTLHVAAPDGKLFTLRGGNVGYGWLLTTTMKREHLDGSGFVMRRPPSSGRRGIAECGFRLALRDVPKGSYYINNWVFFSGGRSGDIERLAESVRRPIKIHVI